MSGFYPLRVASVERETRDALSVTFDVPDDLRERFQFAHGQYVTLRGELDGEDVRRSYSICSAPYENQLRVAIKRVPDGRFSTWAHAALVAGATIAVAPPDGRFTSTLDPMRRGARYLAFAAGSGITPILSIIKATLATEPESSFTLVYGNRASSTVMFREELQNLKDRYLGRLALVFVMSREPQDVDLFSGRIDREKIDALFANWIDPEGIEAAFVCGPESMIRAVREALVARGIEASRVKAELFVAAGTTARRPRPAAVATVGASEDTVAARVVMDGRSYAFTIAKSDETVLDAGLRNGIEMPYSCKGGVCATCRAVLVEGEVDMDVNFALEDYEVRRGFILTCQSYPVSDKIVVDIDRAAHALG